MTKTLQSGIEPSKEAIRAAIDFEPEPGNYTMEGIFRLRLKAAYDIDFPQQLAEKDSEIRQLTFLGLVWRWV